MRYAILVQQNKQHPWRFYIFEWLTSFLHLDRQVSRWYFVLNKNAIFISRIFCIFRLSYENTDSVNWCDMLSLARNNKNLKIAKNWLMQNVVSAMMLDMLQAHYSFPAGHGCHLGMVILLSQNAALYDFQSIPHGTYASRNILIAKWWSFPLPG